MKKQLLFLLFALFFGVAKVWAADGDVFAAKADLITDGGTRQISMRFRVISESDKTCETYAIYDVLHNSYTPAIDRDWGGELIIPETANGYIVKNIGRASFAGCGITGVTFPKTITSIGRSAFASSSILGSLILPDLSSLEEYAFYNCENLTSVSLSCKLIPLDCFSTCTYLESVVFRSPVINLFAAAFDCCYRLKSLSFPNGLWSIGEFAFNECRSLESIILPGSLEIINSSAFKGCTSLKNVTIARETPPEIQTSGLTEDYTPNMFKDLPYYSALHVINHKNFSTTPWNSFFSIESLPMVEQTQRFYRIKYNSSTYNAWGLFLGSNDTMKMLDLKIDGLSISAPTMYQGNLIVSDDLTKIPQEVRYCWNSGNAIENNVIHYDLVDYGFSINGEPMSSLDFYRVPGVKSGTAYIEDLTDGMRFAKKPTLVLDNATLDWNEYYYGLYNDDNHNFTIKVIGDCTLNAPDHVGLELDPDTKTIITGGGTLTIYSKWEGVETYDDTSLDIQDNTKVVAQSSISSGYKDAGNDYGAWLRIKDGGLLAAYGPEEPVVFGYRPPNLGAGIDIRYPIDATIWNNYVYYADGSEVKGDWVVIGPDNQATQDLITGVASPKSSPEGKDFIYNLAGQRLNKTQKGLNIIRTKDGGTVKRLYR